MTGRRYFLGEVVVLVDDENRIVMHGWPDGVELVAAPNPDDEASVWLAHDLGYGGDTWAMSRAHELAHHALAVLDGEPWSPVLRCKATRWPCGHDHRAEERRVLDFQRWQQEASHGDSG